MKPSPLTLARPATVREAVALLAASGGLGRPLAGGQSLVPLLNLRLAAPELLVDLGAIPGLDGVEVDGDDLVVGAMVRQRALERSPLAAADCPLAVQALRHTGHVATRNRGTVGGALAHADAAGELPCALLCLGGSVDVEGPGGARRIAASDLFVTHLTTSLAEDEILTTARFPRTPAGWATAFEEVALRHGDYAYAMVACALRMEGGAIAEARLAAGAAGDRPLRLVAAEAALVAGDLAGAASAATAVVDPPDAPHATADYRRHLVGVLVRRAVERALASEGAR